jgi:hypothetical protein
MKKVYVIFPALALLLFIGYWWNYNKEYEAAKVAQAEADRQALVEKREKEARDRQRAIELALEKQAEQRKEREEREAKRQKEREERQAAKEARDKEDVKKETEAVAKLDERKQFLIGEEAFLRQYVAKAESNQSALTQVIQKIAAAEAARAKAEAEAAAAKKNS